VSSDQEKIEKGLEILLSGKYQGKIRDFGKEYWIFFRKKQM